MILGAYRLAARLSYRLVLRLLAHRARTGKEDPQRLSERLGVASMARPPGPLLWLHAASVGESVSALALIERLLEANKSLHVLMTSGTLTSARLLKQRLPWRAFHQYAPVDLPVVVEKFLNHWRPDLVLWMESELWPHLILETHSRGVAMILVNGRMSRRSKRRWRLMPGTIGRLLSCFDLCLTQSDSEKAAFRLLGARRVLTSGNLKWAAAPLPYRARDLDDLKRNLTGRPLWFAGSTHQGEENIIARVHRHLEQDYPDILTIIAPRHPARGLSVVRALRKAGFAAARRGAGEKPDCGIYLADTLGELGLFYRLADIVFLGGSLVSHGGHNPIEAAQLDCALLSGPHTGNFTPIMGAFVAGGGLVRVDNAMGLAGAVAALLADSPACRRAAAANRGVVAAQKGVLETVAAAVLPYPIFSAHPDNAPA